MRTSWDYEIEGIVVDIWDDLGPSWGLVVRRADGSEERVESQIVALPAGRRAESMKGERIRIKVAGYLEILKHDDS